MFNISYRLFTIHTFLLTSGAILGFILGYILDGLQWDFSSDLVKAHELGIVSEAILNNYPKSRDLLTYFFLLGLPALGSITIWLPWGFRRRRILSRFLYEKVDRDVLPKQPNSTRPILLSLAAFFLVATYFDIHQIYNVENWNSNVGSWPFLGEEGVFLEWTQRILKGEVRGKDFYSIYGPLMDFPLVLLQKMFGPLVSIGRWYAFTLNMISYVIFAFIINRIIRSNAIAVLSTLFMVVIYPWNIYSANMSPLRVALGILPIVPLLKFRENGGSVWIFMAGIAGGASFAYSQEVGLCALLASLTVVVLSYLNDRNVMKLIQRVLMLFSGCTVILLPFIAYFMKKSALTELIESNSAYPSLTTLGYAGFVFPSVADVIRSFNAPLVFDNFWIIAVYLFSSIHLIILFIAGRINARTTIILYLSVFGILLYRAALGRSGIYAAYFVSPPAFILLFTAADCSLYRFQKKKNVFFVLFFAVTFLIVSVIAVKMSFPGSNINTFKKLFLQDNRFTRHVETRTEGIERDDVYHVPDTALEIKLIADFFRTHPTPNDYVYFFPQEPAYYFLFNKRNPTRYSMLHLAATFDMRRELINDLEERKPLYVIYSMSTWRIDGIPEQVYAPEVCRYLFTEYELLEDKGSILFLRRKSIGK